MLHFPTCSLPLDIRTRKVQLGQETATHANLCWAPLHPECPVAVVEFPWALWSTVRWWRRMPAAPGPHPCNSSGPCSPSSPQGKLPAWDQHTCDSIWFTPGCNTSHTLVVVVVVQQSCLAVTLVNHTLNCRSDRAVTPVTPWQQGYSSHIWLWH